MTRALCVAIVLSFAGVPTGFPQTKSVPQQARPVVPRANGIPTSSSQDLPPEEDEDVAPKTYSFNPIQSGEELRIGNYYMHAGKYRAAVKRFEEATKWNPNSAEAFFRLGEAQEKLKNKDAARIAFQRVLRIAPDSKQGHEAKRKLGTKG